MRREGYTFRLLLKAILSASINDDKKGVFVYTPNRREAERLFRECASIILAYVSKDDVIFNRSHMRIDMPNKKTIHFRSRAENTEEKRRGIDWSRFDEMSDLP